MTGYFLVHFSNHTNYFLENNFSFIYLTYMYEIPTMDIRKDKLKFPYL